MLLVPTCGCGGCLSVMDPKEANACTRYQLRQLGYSIRDSAAQSIALDAARIRLTCEKCSNLYVVAGDSMTTIACLCDGPMQSGIAMGNETLASWQWLEQRWYCRDCEYVASVAHLLESGAIAVWKETQGKLSRHKVAARSNRRNAR